MSRFQAAEQQTVAAPTEDEVEHARDFVDALRGDDGRMITEMRLSDGYVSATKMCQSAGKMWADYKDGHRAFIDTLASSMDRPIDLVQSIVTGPNHQRGTWVYPQLAINLAQWCSHAFAVKVTALVLRYLSGQVTTEESRAAARTVVERAAPVEETDEESRALKCMKVRNEIELEKMKHANEMAKVQSSLLNTLATGIAPPSLDGMIRIARDNLARKCLAGLESSGVDASGTALVPAVATQPIIAARRVTVQEFGRDVMGLRGDQLSAGSLSVVGSKLGRMWKSQPGKGEIVDIDSDNGERRWKRTVLENGATRTTFFSGPLDDAALANNRIKFSAAYMGTSKVGLGQVNDVWTYQLNEVDNMMRQAFQV
jgi:hypothetical protein